MFTTLVVNIAHTVRLHGAPCSSLDGVTLAWYIRPIRFENSIRNRIGRPIRFEIRFERKKNDLQLPSLYIEIWDVLNCKLA